MNCNCCKLSNYHYWGPEIYVGQTFDVFENFCAVLWSLKVWMCLWKNNDTITVLESEAEQCPPLHASAKLFYRNCARFDGCLLLHCLHCAEFGGGFLSVVSTMLNLTSVCFSVTAITVLDSTAVSCFSICVPPQDPGSYRAPYQIFQHLEVSERL